MFPNQEEQIKSKVRGGKEIKIRAEINEIENTHNRKEGAISTFI